MRKAMAALWFAGAMAGGLAPAFGANIVANGGFEADDATTDTNTPVTPPSDWTVSAVTDPASSASTTDAGADNAFPHSGSAAAYLGDGTLSQLLTTVPSTSYTISFWVAINDSTTAGDSLATFDASFNGTDLMPGGSPIDATSMTIGTYVNYTDTLVASGGGTTISFTGLSSNDDGAWYLDDVDVEPLATTPVPEPSSLLLLLAPLLAFPLLRRRDA